MLDHQLILELVRPLVTEHQSLTINGVFTEVLCFIFMVILSMPTIVSQICSIFKNRR